jgi:hypothetical protein
MSVVHVFVPGLVRRHLDGVLGAGVLAAIPARRRADLILGFPATIANVQRTMLSGRSARSRGALDHEPLRDGVTAIAGVTEAFVLSLDDAMPDEGIVHLPVFDLLGAIAEYGPGSTAERAAIGHIDDSLQRILAGDHDTILASGPPLQRAQKQIVAPSWLAEIARFEGALAFVPRALESSERDACLGTEGIERVLQGGALSSWGVAPDAGAIVLAEPGWSFVTAGITYGHREIADPLDTPVLLGWGGTGGAWPTAVHDYRIGPTLARAAGLTLVQADAEPLPW